MMVKATHKSTVAFWIVTLISNTVFFILNKDILPQVFTRISNESILFFLVIISLLMTVLTFRKDRRSIIVGLFLLTDFCLLRTVVSGFSVIRGLFSFHFQMPITETGSDYGFVGFIFLLMNGFLIFYTLLEGESIDLVELFILVIGFGFGLCFLLMILLGILWEISLQTIITSQIAILLALLIANLWKGKGKINNKIHIFLKNGQSIKTNKNLLKLSGFIIVAMLSFFVFLAIYEVVAYPAIEWDSLAYGLNYARIIFEKKKVPIIAGPSIGLEMSANYPPGIQLSAVYFYVFSGLVNDLYYRILQPIFGIAVMMTTYKLTIILTKDKNISLFATFLLGVIPLYWEFFIRESYLMCLTLMWLLSAYFLLKALSLHNHRAKKYEVVGTLFCGFSSLISYIGLLSIGNLVIYKLYKQKEVPLKRLTLLVILFSFVILPWYMRNLLLLRNPFYPFFGFGINLDPLLMSSTVGHFQNWLTGPLTIISMICKIGICALSLAIAYTLFVGRKTELNFIVCLTLYSLFTSCMIMTLHVPFLRYLIITLPFLSALICWLVKLSISREGFIEKSMASVFIILMLVSSITVVPYLKEVIKPTYCARNKWEYLAQLYEDADAWKWINENTPQNARIATYEIRHYYIEREVILLDGYAAAPIYKTNNIEEAINYLREQNISYILSATWASPMDTRIPPAYKKCVLTRHLGDIRYLPPVYVSQSGTAVYHVGPLQEDRLFKEFSDKGLIPPLKRLKINVTITGWTTPHSGKFHIPIPLDYREGLMMVFINSYGHSLYVKLLKGIVLEDETNLEGGVELIKEWPPDSTYNSVVNPSFAWEIDRAGYLTFFIATPETSSVNFNVTVCIDFYNYWDKETLFVGKGLKASLMLPGETSLSVRVLYIQINEPSILNINCTTFGKKISLEVFEGFIPNNALTLTDWTKQYKLIKRQPSFNISAEVNPSIGNFFLSFGKYSLLVSNCDNDTQDGIILRIELIPLNQ